jgi:hypothetical protein
MNYSSVYPGNSQNLQIQQILTLLAVAPPADHAGATRLCRCAFKYSIANTATHPSDLRCALASYGQQVNGRLQWQTRSDSAAYRIAVNLLVCCCRGEAL